jgi:type IV pilus biogenesis protein PilP
MRIEPLLLIALVLPAVCFCAELPAPTVGDLSQIQSDTIVYDAKAKRAEAKSEMQKNMAKSGDDLQAGPAAMAPPVLSVDLPTVTGISGAAGRLFATFRYPNGTTVSSKSGEQIPNGFLVAEVGIDRVVLTKGDRRIPLQFGVANPTPAAAQTGAVMLPGAVPAPMPLR